MNTTKLFTLIVLISVLLSACGASAAPEAVSESGKIYEEAPVEVEMIAAEPVVLATAPPVSVAPVYQEKPAATPADNYFQTYGVNPYEDAYEDHLSTFALDVDTASYSVARRYVNDGSLPAAEAVRVEEFINYFDQGYPTPPDIAFGIYADGAPSPFDYDGTHLLRIGVQGYEVPEWQRKPAVLTFVIDVSGSMNRENRLGLVKQSLDMLIERLDRDDTVAIVVYGSEARIVLGPTPGSETFQLRSAVHSLRPEDSTNAEAGLRLGYQVAMQAYQPGATNRVILCSDGVANVGKTGPNAILEEIRGYVSEGIYLTSVGFGMGNFNDVLMEQLANDGNGNYAYVDTLDEAEKLFVEDLTSTLQVIARDAKVQVDFNPDVVSRYRLIGYENRAVADQDFRNDYVDAGELGAGHSATAIYAVQLQPGAEGRIATVQLRWEDPDSYEVHEINGNFNTWDLDSSFSTADPRYQLAVLAAYYAEELRHSPWAADVTLDQLVNYAAPLMRTLGEDPDVVEFFNLLGQAARISH